ncbi:hypothetical protein MXD81_09630, partial [Microbacteriaceae bacterium K1510]|nr:hypothetical protein [Microbacteriaceae bacterium K1510]
MTVSRKLTSITTAAAIALTSLGGFATSASAYDRGGYRGDHYARDYDGPRGGYRDGYRGGRDRYYARNYHKKKNNTGKYIAIGAAALMLGIIASEASRR